MNTEYTGPVTSDNFKPLATTAGIWHGIDVNSVNDQLICIFGYDQGSNSGRGAQVMASCRGDTAFSWAYDGWCKPSIDSSGTTMSWLSPDVQFSTSTAWTFSTINYQTGSTASTSLNLPVAIADTGDNVSLQYTDTGLQFFVKDPSTGIQRFSADQGSIWTQFANSSDGFTYSFLQDGTSVIRATNTSLELGDVPGTNWNSILPQDTSGTRKFQASHSGTQDCLAFFEESGNLRLSTDKGTTWSTHQLGTIVPDSYCCSPDGQKLMLLYIRAGTDSLPDHCDIYTSQNQGQTFKHYYEELPGNAGNWQARMSQDGQHFFLTSKYAIRELAGF